MKKDNFLKIYYKNCITKNEKNRDNRNKFLILKDNKVIESFESEREFIIKNTQKYLNDKNIELDDFLTHYNLTLDELIEASEDKLDALIMAISCRECSY